MGYRTRLDTRVSGTTRIEVVTEGILTRLIQTDPPMLEDYAAVLFDEFHERSLQADLGGLALVRESQQALREDLRLLVMSATLDTAPIAKVLGGDVPVISSEGRAFPVDVLYRPLSRNARMVDHVTAVVLEVLGDQAGSVLVFLPGGPVKFAGWRNSWPDNCRQTWCWQPCTATSRLKNRTGPSHRPPRTVLARWSWPLPLPRPA